MIIIVISVEVTMSMRIKRNSMVVVNIVNLFFIIAPAGFWPRRPKPEEAS